MRIALPQLNYHNGNISANHELMLQAIEKAKAEKADLIVFPELSVCGPFPGDWLEREDFVEECRLTVDKLASRCGRMAAIIGAPNLDAANGIMYNSAYFIQDGEVTDGVHKTILSDYGSFSESRYFVAGEENTPIRFKNQAIRILFDEYEADCIEKNDQLILHIGITPFTTASLEYRKNFLASISQKYHKPVLSVSRTGACTSIIFDGNSMVFNHKGMLCARLAGFKEDFAVIDTQKITPIPSVPEENSIQQTFRALVTGLRDFFFKNGFKQAVLGLSGGIDSAIVAALAAEALGAENVTGLLMPSGFSTGHSVKDAEDLVRNLGIHSHTLPIKNIYGQYLNTLSPLFKDLPFNLAEENLQARIRGMLVMAASNKFGYIALNTSNKSEAAVGYGTLYGDMCGSLAVIGDVYKTDIYKLARYINRSREIIPENTIKKAPSAELRPDQKDQDSLPDYQVLDPILKLYIEENLSAPDIVRKGYKPEVTRRVIQLVDRSEYKRAQCPPVLKISKKAFGSDRKMPF